MDKTYRVERLEDMPKFVPIMFIKDKGMKTPRMIGFDIHDRLVIKEDGTHLYYYNLQCGESSQEIGEFRFIKREATCYNDEFYSRNCQMVNLEKLIKEHDAEIKKNVCEDIKQALLMTEENTTANTALHVYYDVLNKILSEIAEV